MNAIRYCAYVMGLFGLIFGMAPPPLTRRFLTDADFDIEGVGIEPDWRYRYFFSYLQMSPSYWAMHRRRQGEKGVVLPEDEDAVAGVYDDFGDVFNTYFTDWWFTRGLRAFGRTLRPVAVQSVWQGMSGALALAGFHDQFDKHWADHPASKVSLPMLLLTVPLMGSAKDILRQVKEQLARTESLRLQSEAGAGKYQLLASKTREKTLRDARRVFRARLAQPTSQLWRIGNRVKVAPHYETDPKAKATANVGDSREMMAIIVSRHLRRAHLYSENAARGIFPSLAPTQSVAFDIPSQRQWLIRYIKYIESELARLRGLRASSAARRTDRPAVR